MGKVRPVALESCSTINLFSLSLTCIVIYPHTAVNSTAAVLLWGYPRGFTFCLPTTPAGTPLCCRGLAASREERLWETSGSWHRHAAPLVQHEEHESMPLRCFSEPPGLASRFPSLNLLRLEKASEVADGCSVAEEYAPSTCFSWTKSAFVHLWLITYRDSEGQGPPCCCMQHPGCQILSP